MTRLPKPVLFFDGVCGTCNHIVNFLLAADKTHRLMFAPLQGTTAREFLDSKYIEMMSTLVYCDEEGTWDRSGAVIRVLSRLGGLWKLTSLLHVFPLSFLNIFYDGYARHRYKILGKTQTCRLPSPEEKERFLE